MKLYKQLSISLGLLVLVASCAKETDLIISDRQPEQSLSGSQSSNNDVETQAIPIQMGMAVNDDELRVLYNLDKDSGRVLNLAKATNGELHVRVFVCRHESTGDSEAITVNHLKLVGIKEGDKANKYGIYRGTIDVPVRTKNTVKYTIAGALMSGGINLYFSDLYKLNEDTERIPEFPFDKREKLKYLISKTTQTGTITNNQLNLSMPYITDWQDFPRTWEKTDTTRLVLTFKPFGTILRVRIKNTTAREVYVNQIQIESNAYSRDGLFDFSQGKDSNSAPTWIPDFHRSDNQVSNSVTYNLNPFGNSVKLKANETSPWLYVPIFPLDKSGPKHTVMRIIAVPPGEPQRSKKRESRIGFISNKPLSTESEGKYVTLIYSDDDKLSTEINRLKVKPAPGSAIRPAKLAIEYVAPRSVNNQGNAFVSDDNSQNAQLGLFSYQEAMDRFSTVKTFGRDKYSLPTQAELASIFSPLMFYGGRPIEMNSQPYTIRELIEKDIKIGTTTSTYLAYYAKTSATELYAIRFKDASDTHRTAFRYRIVDVANKGKQLQVDCIWLGASEVEIDQVKDPTFWTTRRPEIRSRNFPLYGWKKDLNTAKAGTNEYVAYWTSTPTDSQAEGSALAGYVKASSFEAKVSSFKKLTRLPVILFKRD